MVVWRHHRTSRTPVAHERVVVVRGRISKKAISVRTGATLHCREEREVVNQLGGTNVSKNCYRFTLGYHWCACPLYLCRIAAVTAGFNKYADAGFFLGLQAN